MTLAYIEENILNPSSSAIDVSSKISILQTVSFVAKSWQAVKEATIINCFRKAGFFTLSPSVIDENDEVDPVPLITHAEAKLQYLDCSAISLNRDLTMQHILC